jgi:hypothetical protein
VIKKTNNNKTANKNAVSQNALFWLDNLGVLE